MIGVTTRPGPARGSTVRPAASACTPALGQPEGDLEPGIAQRLRENVANALGRHAVLAKLSEEGLHPVKGVVATPVEAPVDEALDQAAQRAERRRRHERRARRRPRRAAAHRHAEQERGRRPRAHQQRGEYPVDDRPVDDPVDLAEAVPKHGDADCHRHRHEDDEEGRSLVSSRMRETVERELIGSSKVSSSTASTSRVDSPRRNEPITNDSNEYVRVTPLPSTRDAKPSLEASRTLGRSSSTFPGACAVSGYDVNARRQPDPA